MTRPTQPIRPLTETEAAVTSVAHTTTISRSRAVLIPSARASSSPRVSEVQPPTDQQQRDKPQRHRQDCKADIHPAGAGKTAHQPVGDFRKLTAGVRHQLDVGSPCRKERADHNTGQNQVNSFLPRGTLTDHKDQQHRKQAEKRTG